MILTTVDQLKKYVSVAGSFEFADFEPYIAKAANTFIKKYVGNLEAEIEELQTLVGGSTSEDSDEPAQTIADALELLRSAYANFGMFLFMPYLTVQMDSSGISIPQNQERAAPQWWQVKDIRRDLLRVGHESMDLLLTLLEENADLFDTWSQKFNTIDTKLLVCDTATFNMYYNINQSRQTFLALMPTMRMVEDQYINNMLCKELIAAIKSPTAAHHKNLKEVINKAVVAFTVAKVGAIGLFSLEATGLRLDFENYIDGRKQAVDYGKPSQQVTALVNEQINNGTNYLAMAKKYIEDNTTLFTECDGKPLLNSDTTGTGYNPINTKGIFGL